ncbi:hypothetical protein WJT86_04700 [Microvirga sp. W0021]|uniref:Protoheme IX farnesyltransferase n=1 Tax=Hohaiivirga grylli TaxID=3133970 RepID=A0ABV0BJB2_9HYPH
MAHSREDYLVPAPLTKEDLKLRRRRSNAIGISLGVLAIIFFIVTLIKMGAQIH